jgi:pimeloyl-ACP methyl ester carboxylesterase
VLQCLALPFYWWVGHHLLGLGRASAGVFAAAAPFVTHTAGLSAGFVVSWLQRQEVPGRRQGGLRDWLIAVAREARVSIRQFYWLMPLREGFRVPDPSPPTRLPPILLVHGYGCNRGLWLPAARWFAARGHVVRAMNLRPLHASIDRYAGPIAEAAAALRAETGAERVAIVAHSMGGLAARAWLRQCGRTGTDPCLAALVTIGTPHCGTHIARIGQGENARQMRYRSRWTAALLHDEAAAGAPLADPALRRRVTTLCSLQDNIVSRPLEQRLPGVRAIVVRRQGHMSLATSPRIFAVIERLLRRAR